MRSERAYRFSGSVPDGRARIARRLFAACVPLATSIGIFACGSDDAGNAEVRGGGDASVDGATSDATSDAPADGTIDVATDDASDGGLRDGARDAAIADANVRDVAPDIEQPPPDADVCGSGWRTLAKECDDGLGADASMRRSCSSQCQVLDVLAHAPAVVDGGPPPAGRTLGAGRHPLAVTDNDVFAVAYVETQPTVSLSLTHFSRKGVASDVVTKFSGGSTPVADSNPVIAGFSGGRFVVAYTELGGDGDELGIAMRMVIPGTTPSGGPRFANQGTAFNQHDPDAIFIGGQLVVAWVDDSNVATAPDLRFRTFDANLAATTVTDQTLAATASAETDVALAPFGASWTAAWRDVSGSMETVRVIAGNATWSVGPFPRGPGDKPAIAELDATHLLVVFSVASDPTDSGSATAARVQGAILDTNATGAVTPFDIVAAGSEPNAVRVGTRVFVAWRTERTLPDTNGYAEELWLKEVVWNGTTLDTSAAELTLPRWTAHRGGDQRRAALAATVLPVQGALAAAWDDLGRGFGLGEALGDVVLELAPAPPLRLSDGGM